jgi:hypothetical protein
MLPFSKTPCLRRKCELRCNWIYAYSEKQTRPDTKRKIQHYSPAAPTVDLRAEETYDGGNDHSNKSAETPFQTCVLLWFGTCRGKNELLNLAKYNCESNRTCGRFRLPDTYSSTNSFWIPSTQMHSAPLVDGVYSLTVILDATLP